MRGCREAAPNREPESALASPSPGRGAAEVLANGIRGRYKGTYNVSAWNQKPRTGGGPGARCCPPWVTIELRLSRDATTIDKVLTAGPTSAAGGSRWQIGQTSGIARRLWTSARSSNGPPPGPNCRC